MTLRDIVTKESGWKILSVALAVAIWLTVHHTIKGDASKRVNTANGLTTRTFQTVPVLVVSAAADVHEFKVKPTAIQVTISGQSDALNSLDAKQIHVFVDLTGIKVARGLKKRLDISTPPGLALVSAEPAEVDVIAPPK
jgi:YbbR domain-containing protein